ncbi:MAG: preprotein translocase subunit SecG [Spirochaetales bacterium]|nr:preprotein translocase subunit SecG [Spirochaetales bacterium]MBR4426676.1 preprotein translocase subunit SecG [Spirochaetales bacterium]
MAVLSIILLVLFVLVSLFLIFLVSIQSEDNSGLGGIFGGSSDTAFGGRSNRVMNKITAYTVAAFVILAIAVAFVNKSSDSSVLSSLKNSAAATSTTEN